MSQVSKLTNIDPEHEFPKIFDMLSLISYVYNVELKANAKSFCLVQSRRVPLSLMDKVNKYNKYNKIGRNAKNERYSNVIPLMN